MKRILTIILAMYFLITIFSFVTMGNAWLPIMFVLAATIGIPMGLSYPFPLLDKVCMLGALIISLILIVYGLKNNKKVSSQFLVVIGYCIWSLIGLLGLGTGT